MKTSLKTSQYVYEETEQRLVYYAHQHKRPEILESVEYGLDDVGALGGLGLVLS